MQDFTLAPRARLAFAVLAIAGLGTAGVIKLARGSDHQDTPDVELNPAADMTDVYAFPGASPGRTVLVLNSWAFITPAQTGNTYFDPNLLYQFKIDDNTDGVEDKVIQITFNGSGADQTVEVRGPVAPPVPGTMGNQVAKLAPAVTGRINTVLGSADGVQVFAGWRADPFFIDLEQFFRILPDRKPVTGPLAQLPDAPTASAFRNPGIDYVKGFNVLSIVIELPTAQLTGGGNATVQNTLAAVLLPDELIIQTDQDPASAGWLSWALANGWGGRKLTDDVVDAGLSAIFGSLLDPSNTSPGLTTDNVAANDVTFDGTFPYLAAPHLP